LLELDAGRPTDGPRRSWRRPAARPGDDTDTPELSGGKPGSVGGAWQLPQNGTVTSDGTRRPVVPPGPGPGAFASRGVGRVGLLRDRRVTNDRRRSSLAP
jgi:hypothetical protein